ncbi:MAG TPA: tripartite tricarboxylate transporter substrate binding protein [Eoetvoesiella sp.]
MKRITKTLAYSLMGAGMMLSATASASTPYPEKAVRVVLPFAAGGPTDAIGRVVATQMGKELGKPLVIETKPGASGTVGAGDVARAKPDGYTLLMNASVQVIYPGQFAKLNFDPMGDFTPIGVLGTVPMVAVIPSNSKFKTFKELVDHAKANPDDISFASPGKATLPHLVGEFVNLEAKTKMVHIGYRGTAPALTDVAGGHVDLFYAPLAPALPLIQSGRLIPVAVSTQKRIPQLPEVPTIAESLNLKEFDVVTWYGMWAPKGTPAEIITKLNKAMVNASKAPEVAVVLDGQGTTPSNMDAEQTAVFAQAENVKWLQVMKDANIQPD